LCIGSRVGRLFKRWCEVKIETTQYSLTRECASPADACAERNGAILSLDEHFWNSVWRGEAKKYTHSSGAECTLENPRLAGAGSKNFSRKVNHGTLEKVDSQNPEF
jgi:hypothetical protein